MARQRKDSNIINLDTEAFELLSRQVKAKEEENRIAQQTLTALRRRESILNDVIGRYATQGEQLRFWQLRLESIENKLTDLDNSVNSTIGSDGSIVNMLKSYASILRELAEEMSNRLDIFDIEMSRRIGRLEDIEIARLSSDIINPDDGGRWLTGLSEESKRRELRQQYLNLNEFNEQASRHGMNVPVYLLNEINYAKRRIEELELDLSVNRQSDME